MKGLNSKAEESIRLVLIFECSTAAQPKNKMILLHVVKWKRKFREDKRTEQRVDKLCLSTQDAPPPPLVVFPQALALSAIIRHRPTGRRR